MIPAPLPPVVVKAGGTVLADATPLWTGVARLRRQAPVVVVHGGGPQATAMARRLGHEPRIVQGRRVTTELDLDILLWTLRGALNTRLVAQAHRHGIPAAGLSGADGGLVRVIRRPPWHVAGETVDFGLVGDVVRVDPGLVRALFAGGFVPVVAPLGIDDAGQVYNVNADTVAQHLATALGAEAFLLVTEAGAVRCDPSDPASRLATCDAATFAQGVAEGWIDGGMRVKLTVAFEALRAGIPEVYVLAPDDLLERRRATRIIA